MLSMEYNRERAYDLVLDEVAYMNAPLPNTHCLIPESFWMLFIFPFIPHKTQRQNLDIVVLQRSGYRSSSLINNSLSSLK